MQRHPEMQCKVEDVDSKRHRAGVLISRRPSRPPERELVKAVWKATWPQTAIETGAAMGTELVEDWWKKWHSFPLVLEPEKTD